FRPHELTQTFNGNVGGQQAPWFDNHLRLYRFFEYVETHARQTGAFVTPATTPANLLTPKTLPRIPGKININTVWDEPIFQLICNAQPGNNFTPAEVTLIWNKLLQLRNPTNGVPGQNDRPFWPLSAGYTLAAPGTQYPNGFGIEDTLLRPLPNPTLP